MEKNVIVVTPDELSLVQGNLLNEHQLQFLLKKTPSKYIRQRPAKGGGQWDYVTGGYVKKCLNLMFGWNWSFEILEQHVMHGEAIVKGKLTVISGGQTIVKMQFGNKDVVCKKGTEIPLSIGNDLKAASTDCLKKCAAELGIAADIYNKEEFNEVKIDTSEISVEELKELYELKKDSYSPDEQINIERILKNNETASYKKLKKDLEKK